MTIILVILKWQNIFLKAISCVESEALYESSLCYPLMELADVFISEENNGYGDKILGRKIYDLALEKARLESFSVLVRSYLAIRHFFH